MCDFGLLLFGFNTHVFLGFVFLFLLLFVQRIIEVHLGHVCLGSVFS